MYRKTIRTVAALVLLLAAFHAPLRADEVAGQGRDIFKKNQRAVVTVQVVLKTSYSGGERSSTPTESKQDITGTVVDPSGLTVVALSSADPSETYRIISDEYSKFEMEVSDVKILLEDGTEIPAEIVLRDKDLDLAFIRPKTRLESPMTAIDLSKSATAQVLDQVITLNRLNRAAGRGYAASVERISAVIQKPRTFYIPDSTMTSTGLGSPVFALDGKVLGMVVTRAVSAKGAGRSAMRDSMTTIILPAEQILKGAKQAPDAKGDDEKKVTAKESSKDSAGSTEQK
jgi:S1-C subfamily serine protease